MPAQDTHDEPSLIEFHTAADWTVADLTAALDALEIAYTSFALARYLARNAEREREEALRLAEKYWEEARGLGPDWDILLHEWVRLMRRRGPIASRYFPWGPFGLPGPQVPTPSDPTREIAYYLANPESFLRQSDQLSVHKIEMASPGGFSLKGIGEPIKQIRELIKDLCYRNRQQRELADLEILKQKLALAAQYNLTPQQVHVLAMAVIEPQQDLKALTYNGKLTLSGEEPRPLQDSPVTRRRRRRNPPTEGSS